MPVNMDKYLTLRYPEPATILDYFDDPLLILEEPASLREAERATAFRRGEELSALLEDGVLAAGLDKLYAESGWLWAQCAAHRTLCAENFARSMPDVPLKTIVNAPAHTLPAWGARSRRCWRTSNRFAAAARRSRSWPARPVRRQVWPPTCAPKG